MNMLTFDDLLKAIDGMDIWEVQDLYGKTEVAEVSEMLSYYIEGYWLAEEYYDADL